MKFTTGIVRKFRQFWRAIQRVGRPSAKGAGSTKEWRALLKAAVIDVPGRYYLTADVVTDRPIAIVIEASDVELNLNGFRVMALDGDIRRTSEAIGIYVIARKDVTIFNGVVTGFHSGVVSPSTDRICIRGVDASGNSYIGLKTGGKDCVIKENVVRDIGGYEKELYATGIIVQGDRARVERNIIGNVFRQNTVPADVVGEGVGILLSMEARDCVVGENVISNDTVQKNTIAIWSGGQSEHMISANIIVNFHHAIHAHTGKILNNLMALKQASAGSVGIDVDAGYVESNLLVGFEGPLIGTPMVSVKNVVAPTGVDQAAILG